MEKLLVIGLDSVPPDLLFGKLLDSLPNTKRLYRDGTHGTLETCHPPITVPAWMVMMTGKNPGVLGIYGFRHRRGSSYTDGYIVDSRHVSEPTVWEILGERGLKSCVIGLPPSYPPKAINGCLVTCMITPGPEKEFTFPQSLKNEVRRVVGEYAFDVTFRVEERDSLKRELFEMTKKRFKLASHLAREKDWNLFILHEIGFDRLHHAFWKFFDPDHPKYVVGNKYERIAEEYYGLFDELLGDLLEAAGADVPVLLLSDHGSKAMKGAFCINQWLEREGFLKLARPPLGVTEFEKAEVDWTRTMAWGWGGYYARIFLNIKGREREGIVPPEDVPALKSELKRRILQLRDVSGRPMKNSVFEPDELYGVARGDKPDLMVYFDDLNWRSAGTVGHESLYLSENDTGPDDSVHSMNGIFLYHDPNNHQNQIKSMNAEEVAPTILNLFGLPIPDGMKGRAVKLS